MKERERPNYDHNETFRSFHSERLKLRQTKKNRPFEYSKLHEKNARRRGISNIYIWYISMYIELRIQK